MFSTFSTLSIRSSCFVSTQYTVTTGDPWPQPINAAVSDILVSPSQPGAADPSSAGAHWYENEDIIHGRCQQTHDTLFNVDTKISIAKIMSSHKSYLNEIFSLFK